MRIRKKRLFMDKAEFRFVLIDSKVKMDVNEMADAAMCGLIQVLPYKYKNRIIDCMQNAKTISPQWLKSLAGQLLKEHWAGENRCMACGKHSKAAGEDYCGDCQDLIYPEKKIMQRERADKVLVNPKSTSSEIEWAQKILGIYSEPIKPIEDDEEELPF